MPQVAADGTLTYVSRPQLTDRQLVWIERDSGRIEALTEPRGALMSPEISPDGKWVAVAIDSGEGRDLWLYELASENWSQFTFNGEVSGSPAWAASSAGLFFGCAQETTCYKGFGDESATPLGLPGTEARPSADGRWLASAFGVGGPAEERRNIAYRPIDPADPGGSVGEDTIARMTPGGRVHEAAPSPDGRYIAYTSDEDGSLDVFVRPFPAGEGKWAIPIVTSTQVDTPRWSRSGDVLYTNSARTLWATPVSRVPVFSFGQPARLASAAETGIEFDWGYDVTDDGRRILAVRAPDSDRRIGGIVVVQSWFSELARR